MLKHITTAMVCCAALLASVVYVRERNAAQADIASDIQLVLRDAQSTLLDGSKMSSTFAQVVSTQTSVVLAHLGGKNYSFDIILKPVPAPFIGHKCVDINFKLSELRSLLPNNNWIPMISWENLVNTDQVHELLCHRPDGSAYQSTAVIGPSLKVRVTG